MLAQHNTAPSGSQGPRASSPKHWLQPRTAILQPQPDTNRRISRAFPADDLQLRHSEVKATTSILSAAGSKLEHTEANSIFPKAAKVLFQASVV